MSEGKKEILLGDCLELMKDIPNGSIDMILCDLPYGTTACKWWGGYGECERGYNYAKGSGNSIGRKMVGLKDVLFVCGDYFDIVMPATQSVVYCDIPYKNTTGYSYTSSSNGTFNHTQFYEWCYKMKAQGHIVLVSEYESGVPLNLINNIVWRKESKKKIRNRDGEQSKTTEVLVCI